MDEIKKDRRYLMALSVCNGIGPVRLHKLLRYFGSAKQAWEAPLNALQESGIDEKVAMDICDFRKRFFIEEYEEKDAKITDFILYSSGGGLSNTFEEE